MTQTAASAGARSGVRSEIIAVGCVLIGARKRADVELTGKSAAVPVPQFVPVPV
jgi:hypothetical protein